jgi:hypothetical protein
MKIIAKVEWFHKKDWHERFVEVKFSSHDLIIRKSDKLKDSENGKVISLNEIV